MSKRSRSKDAALTTVLALGATGAFAANPPAKAPQMPSGRPTAESQQPVKMEYDPGINEAAVAVQRSGGSLARAQIRSMPPLPPDAKRAREVSFYAIPEPEPRTIRKHDLITIIIREESAFTVKGKTDTKREGSLEASLDEFIKLRLKNWEVEGGGIGPTPPSLKANGTRDFKSEGTANRTDSLTARITGEVVDVKPNGTLVVQARKTIKTDDEEQQFVLNGTCRVEDVIADNTVLSTQMYDLRVEKNTKGAVRSATKRSWLHEILDAISPF
ncbi:flagellar basal body L-ring protein FlgH [Humisphaera borealis]|uniref:Flagellar basal body L-ring protein FlgH n=1 Tax=Humisphaera borealis TaxID=2807512 RepID=A0A7M2X439_9BACT|nr:flagellar basal body L-ring protein FlgH [Humisphaera borealis]QOV91530.1 flagellar basal body L-ring protein FlgH [Humisphaera borealis]